VAIVVVVLVVLVSIILLALFFSPGSPYSPIPRPFSFTISSGGLLSGTAGYTFPSGAGVQFSWHTASGGTVTFSLVNSAGSTIYSQDAASGSDSFSANGNTYTFESYSLFSESTDVSGTY